MIGILGSSPVLIKRELSKELKMSIVAFLSKTAIPLKIIIECFDKTATKKLLIQSSRHLICILQKTLNISKTYA